MLRVKLENIDKVRAKLARLVLVQVSQTELMAGVIRRRLEENK